MQRTQRKTGKKEPSPRPSPIRWERENPRQPTDESDVLLSKGVLQFPLSHRMGEGRGEGSALCALRVLCVRQNQGGEPRKPSTNVSHSFRKTSMSFAATTRCSVWIPVGSRFASAVNSR